MKTLKVGSKQSVMAVMLFTGLIGTLIMGAVTIAAVSDSEKMSYYSSNRFMSQRIGDMREQERTSVQNEQQLWKNNPALVAAVDAPYMRPPVVCGEAPYWKMSTINKLPGLLITTPTWKAEYKTLLETSKESEVLLSVADMPYAIYTLEKPFGNWWYITEINDLSRSGAGPNHPKGVQLVELRPALMKHGMSLIWNAESKHAEVSGPNVQATVQIGFNQTKINGCDFICSACPMVIKGKVFVAEDIMSRIIAESLAPKIMKQ